MQPLADALHGHGRQLGGAEVIGQECCDGALHAGLHAGLLARCLHQLRKLKLLLRLEAGDGARHV